MRATVDSLPDYLRQTRLVANGTSINKSDSRLLASRYCTKERSRDPATNDWKFIGAKEREDSLNTIWRTLKSPGGFRDIALSVRGSILPKTHQLVENVLWLTVCPDMKLIFARFSLELFAVEKNVSNEAYVVSRSSHKSYILNRRPSLQNFNVSRLLTFFLSLSL